MSEPDISLRSALDTAPADTRLMALDLGSKTIGVATTDRTRMIATPDRDHRAQEVYPGRGPAAGTLQHARTSGSSCWAFRSTWMAREGPRCQSTRAFARNFARLTSLPIVFWDERLSTAAVERMLIAADTSRAKRDDVIDKLAAAWMLQSALDSLR